MIFSNDLLMFLLLLLLLIIMRLFLLYLLLPLLIVCAYKKLSACTYLYLHFLPFYLVCTSLFTTTTAYVLTPTDIVNFFNFANSSYLFTVILISCNSISLLMISLLYFSIYSFNLFI